MKSSTGRSTRMSQLSIVAILGTSTKMSMSSDKVPEIFDRDARFLRRRRASNRSFFAETMATDLFERLDIVQRRFTKALLIGDQPLLADGLAARDIPYQIYAGDEDQLQDRDATHDLILSSGTLDNVADLPGALILARRALKPDGLLLANFASAPSLKVLRAAVAVADAECGCNVARFHPQIDVRSAGDLLMRAGFALPVADLDTVDIAYASLGRLLTDLREAGATNMLAKRYPVSRAWLATADAAFAASAGPNGRTHETLSYVTLTAWAPAPTQPQPARRGSGASLTEALRRRGD
jgi:SAM-dependent methyltransferase